MDNSKSIIVANQYDEDGHVGVLSADIFDNADEQDAYILRDIIRIIQELNDNASVEVSLKEDGYGETVLSVEYGEHNTVEYTRLDGTSKEGNKKFSF